MNSYGSMADDDIAGVGVILMDPPELDQSSSFEE